MSSLKWCNKNKVVWEEVCEVRKVVVYKRDKDGNLITDNTGMYAVETDKDGNIKRKEYKKTIHIYKGFPSRGLERENIPSNENDDYFIDSSCTSD
tara:strand:+ start:429 stop:713 length:285 start_codon:yes stop_codon:yes gene_type:complete